ncbi:MAG TPA: glycosyltransferase family 4 protein, partial [Acidimicrobiales bacterium]|nr:glycosyltransferase family 4 protein [Acidimicrobiales bacterium]
KGVDVLVRAFGELTGGVADARLVVVGSPSLGADPGDSARYTAQLERLATGHPVTFLPGRADVVPLLQSADVAVVPSLWPEPLSRALMEPLACGIPVVATDAGGNPEILNGWLADYLVPAGDSAALAARLSSLHGWRRDQPGLGARCRAHAEQFLGLERETDTVERALQDAVAGSRRRRTTSDSERRSCG